MNNNEIINLQNSVSQIDYLFQEGVAFSKDDLLNIRRCASHLLELINDPFMRRE